MRTKNQDCESARKSPNQRSGGCAFPAPSQRPAKWLHAPRRGGTGPDFRPGSATPPNCGGGPRCRGKNLNTSRHSSPHKSERTRASMSRRPCLTPQSQPVKSNIISRAVPRTISDFLSDFLSVGGTSILGFSKDCKAFWKRLQRLSTPF